MRASSVLGVWRTRMARVAVAVLFAVLSFAIHAKTTFDETPGTNEIYSAGELDQKFSLATATNEHLYAKHFFAPGDPFGTSHRGLAYIFFVTNQPLSSFMPATNIVYVDAASTNSSGRVGGPCLTAEGARVVYAGVNTAEFSATLAGEDSDGTISLNGIWVSGDYRINASRLKSADVVWKNALPQEVIGKDGMFISADLNVYRRSETFFPDATMYGINANSVGMQLNSMRPETPTYLLWYYDLNDSYTPTYSGEYSDESGDPNVRVFNLTSTRTNDMYAIYPQTFTATNYVTTNHVGRLAMTNDFSSIGRICNPSNEVDASGNFWRIDETWEVAESNGAHVLVELYRESENIWSYGSGTGYWKLEYEDNGWKFMPEMSDERYAVPRFKKDADALYARMATNDSVNNYVLTRKRTRTLIGKFRVGEDAGWVTTQGVERIVASATNAVPRIVSTENLSYLSADLKYVSGKDWHITRIVMYSGYEVVSNNAKTVWYRQMGSETVEAYTLTIFWGPDEGAGYEKAWYCSDNGGTPSLISYDTDMATFSGGPWDVMNVTYSRDITKVATTNELSALQRVVSARVSDDAKTLYLTNSTGGAEIAFQGGGGGGGGGGGVDTNAVKDIINAETGGTNGLAHAADIAAATNAIPRNLITDGTNTIKATREVVVWNEPIFTTRWVKVKDGTGAMDPQWENGWDGWGWYGMGQYLFNTPNCHDRDALELNMQYDSYEIIYRKYPTVSTLLATTNDLSAAVAPLPTYASVTNAAGAVATNVVTKSFIQEKLEVYLYKGEDGGIYVHSN